MRKVFGEELKRALEDEIQSTYATMARRDERVNNCETDYDDCFVSCRVEEQSIDECRMKLALLEGDGCMDFEALFDENGNEIGYHWFVNQWRKSTVVARGVFASSLDVLMKKTGWTKRTIRVPAWVQYRTYGTGLAGALSGSNEIVRWHTNMVTGEHVGYPN